MISALYFVPLFSPLSGPSVVHFASLCPPLAPPFQLFCHFPDISVVNFLAGLVKLE